MNKVITFVSESLYRLQEEINEFGEEHEIVSVSLASWKHYEYYACVTYKAGEQDG